MNDQAPDDSADNAPHPTNPTDPAYWRRLLKQDLGSESVDYLTTAEHGVRRIVTRYSKGEADDSGAPPKQMLSKSSVSVAPAPILISGIGVDSSDSSGEHFLEIEWLHRGRPGRLIERRGALYDKGLVPALAPYGAPVGSHNVKEISRYLAVQEDQDTRIKTFEVATRNGWGSGESRFVLGETVLGTDARVISSESIEWLQAHRPRGSEQEHIRILQRMAGKSSATRLGVAAGLAAPLLRLLDTRSFVWSISGQTGTGKSALQAAAASHYGRPERLKVTANASQAALNASLARAKDSYIWLDETQIIQSQELGQMMVYIISMDTSAPRATQTGGLRLPKQWRSLVSISGEHPLLSIGAAGGAKNRCIETKAFALTQAEALEFHQELDRTHGHTAPAFIRMLLQDFVPQRERLAEIYRDTFDRLKRGNDSAEIARQLAVIVLADRLWRERCLGENSLDDTIDAGREVLDAAIKSAAEVGTTTDNAYSLLKGYVVANTGRLSGTKDEVSYSPGFERIGYRLASDDAKEWKLHGEWTNGKPSDPPPEPVHSVVALHRHNFLAFVQGQKLDLRQLTSDLEGRGLLLTDGRHKARKIPAKVDGRRPRAYWIVLDSPEIRAAEAKEAEDAEAKGAEAKALKEAEGKKSKGTSKAAASAGVN